MWSSMHSPSCAACPRLFPQSENSEPLFRIVDLTEARDVSLHSRFLLSVLSFLLAGGRRIYLVMDDKVIFLVRTKSIEALSGEE